MDRDITSVENIRLVEGGEQKQARRHWLSNSISKKGPSVWAWSIALPYDRCPFASGICGRYCYAKTGNFPLHWHRYVENRELAKSPEFAKVMAAEIRGLATESRDEGIAVCAHEKGEFFSLDYLRAWGEVVSETRDCTNVQFFVYTRSWRDERYLAELARIADDERVRVNLSTDREMVEQFGVPQRIGDGLVTYLAETDEDRPPESGIHLVFRNLRIRHDGAMETLGGVTVCPNESGLHIGMARGRPALRKGACRRIQCGECRLCIDRTKEDWDLVKGGFLGTPGKAPGIVIPLVQPDAAPPEPETLFGEGSALPDVA